MELPKGKIGPAFTKKILPWVEMFWHKQGRYPTDSELAEKFGFNADDLQRLHSSKFYKECLKERGIQRASDHFTAEQVAALAVITNFHDTRPVNVKLASIGVGPEKYQGWMQNPSFRNELTARADDLLDNVYPEAQAQLASMVKKGHFGALKFYYEVTGRAQNPETVNVKLMMMKVIEAIQRHVKDPAVLEAIAADIQVANTQATSTVVEIPTTKSPVAQLYKETH